MCKRVVKEGRGDSEIAAWCCDSSISAALFDVTEESVCRTSKSSSSSDGVSQQREFLNGQ